MLPTWGAPSERYERLTVDAARRVQCGEIVSPVLPYVLPDQRVLDLGCATGTLARFLVEQGCTVVGVEVDAAAAAHATAWCEHVVVGDLDLIELKAELGGQCFDVVVAGDVLEHLRDPTRVLASLPALLAPDGRIVASLPNVAHGSVRLALLAGEFPYDDAGLLDRTHLRFFTAASARQMFEATGFEVERLERITVPVDQAVPFDRSALPPGVEEAVTEMPEATTFQFVLVARPTAIALTSPTGDVAGRPAAVEPSAPMVAAQAEALRAKDRTVVDLRAELISVERQLHELRSSRLVRARDAFRRWSARLRTLHH